MQLAQTRGFNCFEVTGDPLDNGTLLLAWKAVFQVLFGIDNCVTTDDRTKKLETVLASYKSEEWFQQLSLLNSIFFVNFASSPALDEMEPKQRTIQLIALLVSILKTLLNGKLTLIGINDCHHTDEASLMLVKSLMNSD